MRGDGAGVDAGEHAHDGRRDDRAGREQEVAWLHVVAGGATATALATPPDARVRRDPLGVLDHDDRAGAVGIGAPVAIRIASPCPSCDRRRSAPAATSANDGELDRRRRHVRRPHRAAVDGAVGERRHLLGGDDVGRQHEPVGLLEVDVDRRQRWRGADHPGHPRAASCQALPHAPGRLTAQPDGGRLEGVAEHRFVSTDGFAAGWVGVDDGRAEHCP